MRILRRRSNLEVSAKGFALFVAGLVVSTFVGGAIRTILSSDRVHRRIVRELKNRFPKNDIDVQSIEVLLSRGVWPALGLRVHDLSVRQDVCGKLSFDLRVPETVMPIALWSLARGRVRLGRIEIPGGRLDLDYHACPKPGDAAAREVPTLRETVRERGIRPPRLDWSNIADSIDGVKLLKVEVGFKRAPRWKLKINEARVRFARELDVTASLDLQRSLPFGAISHVIGVTAVSHGGDIDWQLDSELKEGRLRWTGQWNLAENTATAKAQVTQLPIKELATELYQMEAVPKEYKFRSAWLTCAAAWAGPLINPFLSPVHFTACHVEGAYGRVTLDQAEVFLDRPAMLSAPADFHVQHANLNTLADVLGISLVPTVLARAGTFTGAVGVLGPREWNVNGRLEGAEISFSNQSVRGKQMVTSVEVVTHREADVVRLELDRFALQGGSAGGRVKAAYDLDKKAGTVDVDLDNVTFNPAIQHILVGGQLAAVQIRGSGAVRGGVFAGWNGKLSTPGMIGEGWRAELIEAQTTLTPQKMFSINVHAAQVDVDPRWRHFATLQTTLPAPTTSYQWRDVSARILVRPDGGTISALRALSAASTWQLDGTWVRDGEANANLRVGAVGSGRAVKTYRLRGEKGALAVDPN